MNSSAISSAFWLPKPAIEVGWEEPKTKPVQTEVETRLWKICQQTAILKKGWIDALIYTGFAGLSTASVSYAFESLDELLPMNGLTNALNKCL